jgi:3-oxoacyl-[acyl-carrier protein] reductase
MRLQGRAAVVTGSSSGIGRSIALSLAGEGAAVVINARGSRAGGTGAIDAVVDEIRAAGGQAIGIAGAVDDAAVVARLVDGCVAAFGRIDILVNNAAIYSEAAIGPVEGCPIDEWQRILSVNLNAVFYGARAAIPHMKRQRWGRILNAGSFAGTGQMGGSAYCASKAALFGLGRAMAADYGPYGITVNTYNPEAVTAMGDVQDPAAYTAMIARWLDRGFRNQAEVDYLVGLKGPDGVAPWVTYLCTEEGGALNGHVFAVEGRRVALLGGPDEERVLVRDYEAAGPWALDELARMAPLAFPLPNRWPRRDDIVLDRWDAELVAAG